VARRRAFDDVSGVCQKKIDERIKIGFREKSEACSELNTRNVQVPYGFAGCPHLHFKKTSTT